MILALYSAGSELRHIQHNPTSLYNETQVPLAKYHNLDTCMQYNTIQYNIIQYHPTALNNKNPQVTFVFRGAAMKHSFFIH